jgi:peptidyl-dipeptidase A
MACSPLFFPFLVMALGLVLACPGAVMADSEMTGRARRFVQGHEKRIKPLEIAAARAWWDANISGKSEDFARKVQAQNRIDRALSDRAVFAELKALEEGRKQMDDPILARTIHVLYLLYLEKQVDPHLLEKMVEKANRIEQKFNVFRARVDGQEMTDNQVRKLLKESTYSPRLQAVWEASKKVGAEVADELHQLVLLRNEAAGQLGFRNFHALQLYLNEQDGKQVLALFDELDELTRRPFEAAKADIDARLARRYGIDAGQLRPWHFHDPFFQDVPAVLDADLDAPFQKADLPRLCRDFYAGIGLPVDRVLARSDLYEKPGKSQHAFCTDIDRAGDVRVLANLQPNNQWASTLLHELGHSVYSTNTDNIPATLPYPIRLESHILTTEGVAMMFERLAKRSVFLEKMGLSVKDRQAFDAAGARALRYRLLIFSRWCQVMLRFEKSLYENPDQDLNRLWWDLVEKYQGLRRPADRNEPDYASKVHIVSAPVYYHNYMMGELFASQVHHAIARELYRDTAVDRVIYVGNKEVGDFMRKRVFAPGRSLSWNELTRHATGQDLNPRAFAADFKAE